MSTQQQQFEFFWAILKNFKMDHEDLKNELKATFLKSTENQTENKSQKKKQKIT